MVHLFQGGLAWHTIVIYHSAISTFLEPHHLHKASKHPVISKLMHHFYLQCPPSYKHFDPWDVEHLLSLLESWAPTSSLTTFKPAWKTATLLALVTVKCCSDLTLLCIDNQHLFLQHHTAIFIPLSVARQIIWVIFPLRLLMSLTPVLIFFLFFIWRLIWDILNHLGWSQMEHVWLLILHNNRQHRPVYAKTISSWVRKFFVLLKHICLQVLSRGLQLLQP